MKALAMSGASRYSELCTGDKNEEKHLDDLRKRQHHAKGPNDRPHSW